ncbi:hypothetical protein TNCV_2772581 [Trichonephila clavipes]|nr:hypothetical protein TNCV_2772581 [Trichonephila clavipes]
MLLPLWNPSQASILDSTPLLYSNVSGQPIECLLTECYQPTRQAGLSSNIRNFLAKLGCLRSTALSTPPCHILSTNQESHIHKGPLTSDRN